MAAGHNASSKRNLATSHDDISTAEAAYKESIDLFLTSGFKSVRAWAHIGFGYCFITHNQWDNARKQFEQGIANGRETGDKIVVLFSLLGFYSISGSA